MPKRKDTPGNCPHNPGIDCSVMPPKCHRCGWNPKIEAQRKAQTGGRKA